MKSNIAITIVKGTFEHSDVHIDNINIDDSRFTLSVDNVVYTYPMANIIEVKMEEQND